MSLHPVLAGTIANLAVSNRAGDPCSNCDVSPNTTPASPPLMTSPSVHGPVRSPAISDPMGQANPRQTRCRPLVRLIASALPPGPSRRVGAPNGVEPTLHVRGVGDHSVQAPRRSDSLPSGDKI